ncbi:related to APP1-Actin Patch Protein [Zygosaccharomyces bailii ISA1307]|nr:related to APP1-Actin Patch Protein [Zygosaccharomyces bailii ISA1307]
MERCDNQFNESPNETAALGRRQRFMNLVKTTKNVYIPSLTSTISQKTESFRNHEEYQPYSNLTLDTDILYYPTYTTRSAGVYETAVRFVVSAPGNPQSRKNRILMSLCRQYLLPRNITEIDQELLDQKLDDALTASDTKSMLSNGTTDSTLSGTDAELVHSNIVQSECEVLKTRIAGFLERKIASIPAIVDVFTNEGLGHYETSFCTTDNMGYVETRLRTSFEPKKVRITLDTPSEFPKVITHEFTTNCIKAQGYGLISDVDDTIKHTGVTGDKRSMFRNVFVHDFASWNIEGVSRWYRTLKDSRDVDFFYVSNSPMQTYNTLEQYICTNFPRGPLFLKQYSGNILSSIWSSSADRKLGSITQILQDFPNKRFFLVGDSGEQDFEAYISTVLNFPDQVAGIYIRCCKDSLSDMGLREAEVLLSLNEMIKKEYMSEYKKTPPEVPKRKSRLTTQQQEAITLSRPSVTYLRPRPVPPSLPPRPTQPPPPIDMTYTQNGYHNYDTFFDKRAEHWRHRVYVGLQQLKRIRGEGHIRLLFFVDPELPLEDSMETMRRG